MNKNIDTTMIASKLDEISMIVKKIDTSMNSLHMILADLTVKFERLDEFLEEEGY